MTDLSKSFGHSKSGWQAHNVPSFRLGGHYIHDPLASIIVDSICDFILYLDEYEFMFINIYIYIYIIYLHICVLCIYIYIYKACAHTHSPAPQSNASASHR